MSYNIGDKLYFVYSDRRRGEPQEVTIKSIGRKWIALEQSWFPRINKDTLAADAGAYTSPGHCYASKEAYDLIVARNAEWASLRIRVGYKAPDHLSTDDIKKIIAVLDGEGE